MLTKEQIKGALQDVVLQDVVDATGVNRNTLGKIKNGRRTDLRESTIKRLSDYLTEEK